MYLAQPEGTPSCQAKVPLWARGTFILRLFTWDGDLKQTGGKEQVSPRTSRTVQAAAIYGLGE